MRRPSWDAIVVAGVALVAAGLYAVDWRLAAVTIGAGLVWLGLWWLPAEYRRRTTD